MLRQAPLIFAISLAMFARGQTLTRTAPSSHRHAKSDLEVTEVSTSQTAERTYFLSRSFLAGLPQVSTNLQADENFPKLPLNGTHITGIDLGVLIKALAPDDPSSAVVAICRDGYTSPFPQPYISQHHPILVLTLDGLPPDKWAFKHHAYNAGPFFVTYQDFSPAFHVLAHEDRAQHPAEIVRLKIIPSSHLLSAITPPAASELPADSPILAGFQIAQQNCFRCHNSGGTGGTKANRTWQRLSEVAKTRPEYFADWVHNPQAIDPKARMTPNLKYDQATLNALTRYFQSLTP